MPEGTASSIHVTFTPAPVSTAPARVCPVVGTRAVASRCPEGATGAPWTVDAPESAACHWRCRSSADAELHLGDVGGIEVLEVGVGVQASPFPAEPVELSAHDIAVTDDAGMRPRALGTVHV